VSGDAAPADRDEWADRFDQQAGACAELGSPLYGRLLGLVGEDIRSGGSTWDVLSARAELRFGQAGPLRLAGAAHRLALAGAAPHWAALLPSCGGTPPTDDDDLAAAWQALVAGHAPELRAGLDREVQTNEVARAAGLGLAAASTGFDRARLVELGCSGGLNLRLDRFRIELGAIELGAIGLGGTVLGDPDGVVRLAPDVDGPVPPGLRLPVVEDRIGIDPHPIDPTTDDGRLTLLCFVWPDQMARLERVAAAIDVARDVPADLRATADTAGALAEVLAERRPTIVQHSIVWQYVPTAVRWAVTAVIEQAGRAATDAAPLAWVRYEPDEWNRARAAVWLRTWPGGADRLVAHVDFHGRWLAPLPAP
jgi:hypothetical protein